MNHRPIAKSVLNGVNISVKNGIVLKSNAGVVSALPFNASINNAGYAKGGLLSICCHAPVKRSKVSDSGMNVNINAFTKHPYKLVSPQS